jgi:hypothetical protein
MQHWLWHEAPSVLLRASSIHARLTSRNGIGREHRCTRAQCEDKGDPGNQAQGFHWELAYAMSREQKCIAFASRAHNACGLDSLVRHCALCSREVVRGPIDLAVAVDALVMSHNSLEAGAMRLRGFQKPSRCRGDSGNLSGLSLRTLVQHSRILAPCLGSQSLPQ